MSNNTHVDIREITKQRDDLLRLREVQADMVTSLTKERDKAVNELEYVRKRLDVVTQRSDYWRDRYHNVKKRQHPRN
jgi:hypothetical protein